MVCSQQQLLNSPQTGVPGQHTTQYITVSIFRLNNSMPDIACALPSNNINLSVHVIFSVAKAHRKIMSTCHTD